MNSKLAATLVCMNTIVGQGPYNFETNIQKIKEKKVKDSNGKFIVKIGKQYIGENGLVDKKENAFVYTSYNIAQEDSTAFSYKNMKVKIIKL